MKALIAGLAALVVAGAALPAIAQDSSARAIAPHFTPEQAAAFSKQMERDLADRGARVAIVFRAGRMRDQLPDGIAYTHGAFWVYRDIQTDAAARRSLDLAQALVVLQECAPEALPAR